MASKPKRNGSQSERSHEKRWTKKLMADGYTPVSSYFLENHHRLKPPLATAEVVLIIQLMSFKWDEDPPFPAFKTLAERMGVSATAVRNHARKLETGKHYLKRVKRVGLPNLFDLTPLFAAMEKLWDADQRKARGKPKKKAKSK